MRVWTENGSMVIESTRTPLPPSIVYTYLLQKKTKKYLDTRGDIRIFTYYKEIKIKVMSKKLKELAQEISRIDKVLSIEPYNINERLKKNELVKEMCTLVLHE